MRNMPGTREYASNGIQEYIREAAKSSSLNGRAINLMAGPLRWGGGNVYICSLFPENGPQLIVYCCIDRSID